VTLFIRSFMSPGRITSRIPTDASSRPNSAARRHLFNLARNCVCRRRPENVAPAATHRPALRFLTGVYNYHILLAALIGWANVRQQQIIEFQNDQIEALLKKLGKNVYY
jgi:hypothetical protein